MEVFCVKSKNVRGLAKEKWNYMYVISKVWIIIYTDHSKAQIYVANFLCMCMEIYINGNKNIRNSLPQNKNKKML